MKRKNGGFLASRISKSDGRELKKKLLVAEGVVYHLHTHLK